MSQPTLLAGPSLLSRKRTTSFSSPSSRPTKVPRMTPKPIQRTSSYATLPGLGKQDVPVTTPKTSLTRSMADTVPYHRTLAAYKEIQLRRKAVLHRRRELEAHPPITIEIPRREPPPSPPPSPSPIPTFELSAALTTGIRPRASSPLAPTRTLRPARASFPHAKHTEPDLYRVAIKTRMGSSPAGRKILLMGPRLALSLLSATQELEKIVAKQRQDIDINMADGTGLNNSWVVVGEDWEMIDCSA